MDEDFSYYLDAARFNKRAAQKAKQPAEKDKQPQPAELPAKDKKKSA